MNCPPTLADLLLTVIQIGVLRIRAAGWNNDAACCAAEADHIHNLVALLRDYSDDLLQFYWNVERVAFLDQIKAGNAADFEPIWSQIRTHIDRQSNAMSA
jgi:hypothetical protein